MKPSRWGQISLTDSVAAARVGGYGVLWRAGPPGTACCCRRFHGGCLGFALWTRAARARVLAMTSGCTSGVDYGWCEANQP